VNCGRPSSIASGPRGQREIARVPCSVASISPRILSRISELSNLLASSRTSLARLGVGSNPVSASGEVHVKRLFAEVVKCGHDDVAVQTWREQSSDQIRLEDAAVLALSGAEAVEHHRGGGAGADGKLRNGRVVGPEWPVDPLRAGAVGGDVAGDDGRPPDAEPMGSDRICQTKRAVVTATRSASVCRFVLSRWVAATTSLDVAPTFAREDNWPEHGVCRWGVKLRRCSRTSGYPDDLGLRSSRLRPRSRTTRN